MLQLISLALTITWLAAPGAASECLDRPANQITVVAPGVYREEFEVTPPGDFHTYDLRDAQWQANPPEHPVQIDRNLNGACVVGARVVGQQARDLTWEQAQSCCHSNDGVRFVYRDGGTVGHVTGEGLWIDNTIDGFEPVRYTQSAGRGYSWTLRSSYFRHIRDDTIENDSCHGGEVIDVLADGVYVFISSRPGSGKQVRTGALPPSIKVHDSLVHIDGAFGGRPWKWPGSSSSCTPEPVLDVRNTILRIDREYDGRQQWPAGTYQNVTVVWLGGGPFPVELPPGVALTGDVAVWDEARDAWLERHGCDLDGDRCTNLTDPGSEDEPPATNQRTLTILPVLDTVLSEASPTRSQGSGTRLSVDGDDEGKEKQVLIAFDLRRVPAGAAVLAADLRIETTSRGDGADLHRMLVPWEEASTWESMVAGIQADGLEADPVPDFSTGFVESGTAVFDVTASVQAWVDGTANYGFALLPLGANGWDFSSREGTTPPTLTIAFEPPDPRAQEPHLLVDTEP